MVPFYEVGGQYVECATPGGNWIGDCRFQDAVMIKVDAKVTLAKQGREESPLSP